MAVVAAKGGSRAAEVAGGKAGWRKRSGGGRNGSTWWRRSPGPKQGRASGKENRGESGGRASAGGGTAASRAGRLAAGQRRIGGRGGRAASSACAPCETGDKAKGGRRTAVAGRRKRALLGSGDGSMRGGGGPGWSCERRRAARTGKQEQPRGRR
ncbi:uncharacterized protein LOC130135060 [Syzygium oleosum]|uniref:uncharacterized protein LOC130135060 n=1 Tax=Syzygium oleosum TaxID=219896 RepID=UPI0024B91CE3|nr:uncharacterized protein LOC130135060 [Syzygium oleosum]